MTAKELRALARWQKMALKSQSERISLLEDKVEEVRKKYFSLKYPEDILFHPKHKAVLHN